MTITTNHAVTYRRSTLYRPATLDELQRLALDETAIIPTLTEPEPNLLVPTGGLEYLLTGSQSQPLPPIRPVPPTSPPPKYRGGHRSPVPAWALVLLGAGLAYAAMVATVLTLLAVR